MGDDSRGAWVGAADLAGAAGLGKGARGAGFLSAGAAECAGDGEAYALGELSAFDLYRVRQIQLEAQRMQASAAVSVGAAVSRVNQAQGYAP